MNRFNVYRLHPVELYQVLAAIGDLSKLKLVHEYKPRRTQQRRINRRRSSIVKWTWSELVCDIAARYGHLSILQYAVENNCPINLPRALEICMQCDQLACLKFCFELRTKMYCDSKYAWGFLSCEKAASNGSLSCLQFAYETGCTFGDSMYAAAKHGHVDCLRYIGLKTPFNLQLTTKAADAAAIGGHLACLQYLFELGCNNRRICEQAAKYGQLECMIFARNNGSKWKNTCEQATMNGHLACLKYAHTHGAKWHQTCTYATAFGQLECLKYAHQSGAPWDSNTYSYAKRNSANAACLAYLEANNCPRS